MERRNKRPSFVSRERLGQIPFKYLRMAWPVIERDLGYLVSIGLYKPDDPEWLEDQPQAINLREPQEASVIPLSPLDPPEL